MRKKLFELMKSSISSCFCLAVMSIILWLSAPAGAGMISGNVSENGKSLKETEINVKDSRNIRYRVKTDKDGKFSVNLPPGIYKATNAKSKSKTISPTDKNRKKNKEVLIQSSPQPSSQNIDFGGR